MESTKLITPPHLKVAMSVEDPLTIVEEAKDILQGIRSKRYSPRGSNWEDCFAMAQPQVSPRPLRYFVLNDTDRNEDYKKILEAYGGAVIVNPVLESKDKMTRIMFKDACMSYPFRPVCKVKRYSKIIASYDIITDIEGEPKVEKVRGRHLSDLAALVFLHELEHLNGKSIYS